MGMRSGEVKKTNRDSILRYMLHSQVATKQQIASAMDLSIPTVTQGLKELEEMGLVAPVGSQQSIGGRKAMGFIGIKDHRVAIGVDITPNHVNIVVVDLAFNALYVKRNPICIEADEQSYQKFCELVERAITESGVSEDQILGLGISLPAIIDRTGTGILGLHEKMKIPYSFYREVKDYFRFSVILRNDANCAALAESCVQKFEEDKIYFFISQSVGGAIITDGKIDEGKLCRAGEFGHMTLVPNGQLCYCGRRGCTSVYLSTTILAEAAGNSLERFFSDLDSNAQYQAIWNSYLDKLALAIHNLTMAFDRPIVIGGYLGQFIDQYIQDLWVRIVKMDRYLQEIPLYIEPAKLKVEAAAMGAAAEFIDKYLQEVKEITF